MIATTKPKASLLDLTEQLDQLGQLIEENEGELTPELEELLDQLVVQDKEKIGRIGWMLKDWDADAADLKVRIASYRERITVLTNKKARLLGYIKYIMELRGVNVLYGTPWDLKIRKNGGQDPIKLRDGVEPEDLPKLFQRVTVTPDKDALRAALLADESEPSRVTAEKLAYIGERGSSLRVT